MSSDQPYVRLPDQIQLTLAEAGEVTTRLTKDGIRSPEAARRLGIRGRDVSMMLFAGEL